MAIVDLIVLVHSVFLVDHLEYFMVGITMLLVLPYYMLIHSRTINSSKGCQDVVLQRNV